MEIPQWSERRFNPGKFFDEHWLGRAVQVKTNARRTVYHLAAADSLGTSVFVKHDHPRTPRNLIKNLWGRKAESEFLAGLRLEDAGVPVVRVLAWGKTACDSFLVTEALDNALDFFSVWQRVVGHTLARWIFLQDLHNFLHLLFRSGVDHPDMHAGNLLVLERQGHFEFVLVDLYGIRIRKKNSELRQIRMLCWLNGLRREFNLAERKILFANLLPGLSALNVERMIREEACRIISRKWRGRRLRFFSYSSLCEKREDNAGTWRIKRPFTYELACSIVKAYDEQALSGEGAVKVDRKRCVYRVHFEGQHFIVKEFRFPGSWGRFSSDCRSWLNAQRLGMYALPGVEYHAWLRRSCGTGILILEDVGPHGLYDVLSSTCSHSERRLLLDAAGRLVGAMHAQGILQGDMKTSNVMFDAKSPYQEMPLRLIDLDNLRFDMDVTAKRSKFNLNQLLDTMPPTISRLDKAALLAAYRRERGLSRDQMRRICVS